jgi:hypothetical protein
MSAVLTNEFQANILSSFISTYLSATSGNVTYLFFGKASSWPADVNGKAETDTGFLLPIVNPLTAPADFRANTPIAGVKINSADVSPAIPRVNWATNMTYPKGQVVITNEWNVYLATTNIVSNTIPTSTDYTQTLNGWKFQYKIADSDWFTKFVTSAWIPVPLTLISVPDTNPNPNALYECNASSIIIYKVFNATSVSLSTLSTYRQIALWGSIKSPSAANVTADLVTLADINPSTGTIIYCDNRHETERYEGVDEEFKIVIGI